MPKKDIDYSKTKMYKLVCNDLTVKDVYVGHTTNWIKRKNKHKYDCNNENSKSYNYKVYKTIRVNGGWDNWTMVWIEDFESNNIFETTARERYWYEQLGGTLNTKVPNRSQKEYDREYYENNKKRGV